MVISWVTNVVRQKVLADQRSCVVFEPSYRFSPKVCCISHGSELALLKNHKTLSLEMLSSVWITDVRSKSPYFLHFYFHCFLLKAQNLVFSMSWSWRVLPLTDLMYPSSFTTARLFVTSRSHVALFLFYVGLCVSLIMYFQCSLTAFFETVFWSIFLRASSWCIVKL